MIAEKYTYLEVEERLPEHLLKRTIVRVPTAERGGYIEAGFGYMPTLSFGEEALSLEAQTFEGRWRYPRELYTDEELTEAGYTVERRKVSFPISPALYGAAERITMRDPIQEEALAALEGRSGHLVLAAGKGKTVVALKSCADAGTPFIVFIHNGGLLTQWRQRVESFLGTRPMTIVARGPFERWKNWKHADVVIATFQSFHSQYIKGKVPKEFLERFGTAVFDEAHHVKARTFSTAIHAFPGRRLALTATPSQGGYENLAYAHVGPVLYEDHNSEMYPVFRFVPVNLPKNHQAYLVPAGNVAHSMVMDTVLGSNTQPPCPTYISKAAEIVSDCLRRGHNVIVLTPRLGSAYALYNTMVETVPDAQVLDGTVPFEDRADVLERSQLTIVSQSIGEEGLDRPNLSAAVMLYPFGSGQSGYNKMYQAAGRVLRRCEGKMDPEVYVLGPSVPSVVHHRAVNEGHAKALNYEVDSSKVYREAAGGLAAMLGGPAEAPKESPVETAQKISGPMKKNRFAGLAGLLKEGS